PAKADSLIGPSASVTLCAAGGGPHAVGFAALHGTVEIGELLAPLPLEDEAGSNDRSDAIDAEGAEIVAHLAPGNQCPHLAPEPRAERRHVPRGDSGGLVVIWDGQRLTLLLGALDKIDIGASLIAHLPLRRVDFGAGDAVPLIVGQD